MDNQNHGHPSCFPSQLSPEAMDNALHELQVHFAEDYALSSMERYQKEGGEPLLAEVIRIFRKVFALRPHSHPCRLDALVHLSFAIYLRYRRDTKPSDLVKIIRLNREALTLEPPGYRNRSDSLNRLAVALFERYERIGESSDLLEAIELNREALALRPLGHPHHSVSLNGLTAGIIRRYELDGEPSDLLEVIELNREELKLQPPGHPDRGESINDLGAAIFKRDSWDARPSDLLEVIELYREALTLLPLDHPNRWVSLNNFASAIHSRYNWDGKESDLLEVIKLHREVLTLLPLGHPNRSASLNNLANVLLKHHRRKGGQSDLPEVIALHRESLSLLPPGNPAHSAYLNNLAIAVIERYDQDGENSDLLEGIELHMTALALRPPGHPDRSASLGNLAIAFRLKFISSSAIADISAARKYQEEAFRTQTADNLWWSSNALGLAEVMFDIFRHREFSSEGDLPLAGDIIQLLRKAVATKTSPIPDRLRAALKWAEIGAEIDPLSVSEAYRYAFIHIGGALTLSRSLHARHSDLLSGRIIRGLAINAALWALTGTSADPKLAVELLDQGRNVLLASVGQFRPDLSEVRRSNPRLADEFYQTSRLLDSAILTGQEVAERKSSYEDPASRYQRVSADWEAVVAKIRLLPGCESFLLQMPFTKLREAAVGGPVIVVLVGKERSTAIIVTVNDEPHVVELPNASEEALKTLYEELENAVGMLSQDDDRGAIEKLPLVLSELWRVVVEPVIEELRDFLHVPLGSRIWWYPTSWASFLPLHAAGSYSTGGSNVPDLYVSSYTPTLQALRRARDRSTSSWDAVRAPLVIAQAQTPGQVDIVHVNDEVEMVRRLVPNASLLSGDQGTKESVMKELRNHSWVHLACHGHPDLKDPFQSNFALHDGPLSLQDIIANDLPSAEFAFLSACHSAAPDRTLPDEGLTLAGGMQFVGFKSVVGMLWEMADEDASTLARVFCNGVTKRSEDGENLDCTKTAEALHEAVQRLRGKKVPLYRWVNPVYYGI